MEPDLDPVPLRARIRWAAVGPLLALVLAAALVVLWPRLAPAPPALPPAAPQALDAGAASTERDTAGVAAAAGSPVRGGEDGDVVPIAPPARADEDVAGRAARSDDGAIDADVPVAARGRADDARRRERVRSRPTRRERSRSRPARRRARAAQEPRRPMPARPAPPAAAPVAATPRPAAPVVGAPAPGEFLP